MGNILVMKIEYSKISDFNHSASYFYACKLKYSALFMISGIHTEGEKREREGGGGGKREGNGKKKKI